MTDEQTSFLAELSPAVQAFSSRTGFPASVLLAQAILESDWGRSSLARDHYNFFGLKARPRPNGSDAAHYTTTEYAAGRPRRERAAFARFDSLDACLAEYARILSLPRYARARAVVANPFGFAVELQRCGFATDPRYARKLALVIRRYRLTRFDVSAPAPPRKSEISNLKSPRASRKESQQ